MSIKTFLWSLGLVLVFTASPLPAQTAEPPRHPASLFVSVFDDAGLPLDEIRQAEKVASQVFAHVAISIEWLNCPTPDSSESQINCREQNFPHHLHVRIVTRSRDLNPSIFGISYLDEHGQGCQADIFYSSAVPLKHTTSISTSTILGLVIAHELGHLLLGSNSHATTGLMRAHWNRDDLAAALQGRLFFTAEQAQALKIRLETQLARNAFAVD